MRRAVALRGERDSPLFAGAKIGTVPGRGFRTPRRCSGRAGRMRFLCCRNFAAFGPAHETMSPHTRLVRHAMAVRGLAPTAKLFRRSRGETGEARKTVAQPLQGETDSRPRGKSAALHYAFGAPLCTLLHRNMAFSRENVPIAFCMPDSLDGRRAARRWRPGDGELGSGTGSGVGCGRS